MIGAHLIKSCIKGERNAQKELYTTCAPYVYAVIKSYISDQEERKDLMQESFTSIFKNLHSYNADRGKFKSWISQIATFKCIDQLKKNNQITFISELAIIEPIDETQIEKLDQLQLQEIESLLEQMPQGYRTIFMLNVIDDYSHVEISQMLGISPETSRSQLSRAITWIKKNISPSLTSLSYGQL